MTSKILPGILDGLVYSSISSVSLGSLMGFSVSTYCYLQGDKFYSNNLMCIKYTKTDKSYLGIPLATVVGGMIGGTLVASPVIVPIVLLWDLKN